MTLRLTQLSAISILALSALFMNAAIAQPAGGMGDGGNRPDFATVAETLGVTEEALIEALGSPPPDFAAAAEQLGVTEEALMEAMPAPPSGQRPE